MNKLKAVVDFKYCYKVDTSLSVSSYDSIITFNLANKKKSRYFRVVFFVCTIKINK